MPRTRTPGRPPPVKKDLVLSYYREHPDKTYRPMEVAEALGLPTHFVAVASGRLANAGLLERHHLTVEGWVKPMTTYGATTNGARKQ